ncbi:ClbS/DfsB family four-helix bundle protein [Zunongwangia sp. HRR-M8]|uniref:ClbS/DfsB family four-helix bundle protein n=1 Tax=Zunongwangia sp. HRR-M8 TaxID=3015170 RepID=UPI0022DDA9F3|nr:ClbS/DfsB family four-helix bundle protein [Zunongwangia sp. HRR-M8]WBL22523.1 ClbS/DfsB family four-helix bundle protein [Zunongwangia sp. HRR-M8]
MAVPTNKKELIDDIKTTYSKLKKDLEDIPLKSTKTKELEGHAKDTNMSVCNLVSYLIGWGELVLKWDRKMKNNKEVDFPETGYKWNELGKLANKFYLDYEHLPYLELLEKLDKVFVEILEIIENNSNKELYQTAWYGKWTKGKMIQFNTSSPYKNARTRIRRWKKSKEIT